ncbi:MAG: glycosyltransferase [Planktomarina sp.]
MRVAILLATYQGADFLSAQLDSFVAQDHRNWTLIASDDASGDATSQILQNFASKYSASVTTGPRSGFAANFLQLLGQTPHECDAVAFSDQDDVWSPQKLSRATAALTRHHTTPALYCSHKVICDANLQNRHCPPIPKRPLSFENALVQNVASGNTIVLNRAAIDVLRPLIPLIQSVPFHDWWVYQMMTGMGHPVIFDRNHGLLYRQHANNKIGAGRGLANRMTRMYNVLRGHHRDAYHAQLGAVYACRGALSVPHQRILAQFMTHERGWRRARIARSLGLYRQSKLGTASLYTALALGVL